jgi:hypothetical protein
MEALFEAVGLETNPLISIDKHTHGFGHTDNANKSKPETIK